MSHKSFKVLRRSDEFGREGYVIGAEIPEKKIINFHVQGEFISTIALTARSAVVISSSGTSLIF